jgi:hypothetical protein
MVPTKCQLKILLGRYEQPTTNAYIFLAATISSDGNRASGAVKSNPSGRVHRSTIGLERLERRRTCRRRTGLRSGQGSGVRGQGQGLVGGRVRESEGRSRRWEREKSPQIYRLAPSSGGGQVGVRAKAAPTGPRRERAICYARRRGASPDSRQIESTARRRPSSRRGLWPARPADGDGGSAGAWLAWRSR